MSEQETTKRPPGTCLPWDEQVKRWPEIKGDKELVRRIWEETDGLAYMYVWHCLLSF